jgi:hypothetical protein
MTFQFLARLYLNDNRSGRIVVTDGNRICDRLMFRTVR